MLRIILVLSVCLLTAHCSSLLPSSTPAVSTEEPMELVRAKKLMAQGLNKDAESLLQSYLVSAKDIGWHGEAYLTLGNLYEITKDDNQATLTYQKAIKYGTHYHSPTTSQSLYRLSWIYERQKKYQEMLLVLLDLLKSPSLLRDPFVSQVEAPARIANAYYVLDQWNKALEYRGKIRMNLESVTEDTRPYSSLLYKSFAGLTEKPNETYERHLERLQLAQKDILEVGEMGDGESSPRAYSFLRDDYEKLIQNLSLKPTAIHPVDLQQKEKVRLEKLVTVMDTLQLLKSYRRPVETVRNTESTHRFFKDLSQIEKQVQSVTYQLKLGLQPSEKGKNPNEQVDPKKTRQKIKGANE